MDRVYVSPMAHFNGELEKVTRRPNLRMLAPRLVRSAADEKA
jgi:hypothetical protein